MSNEQTVFIIDDNVNMLSALGTFLQASNLKVRTYSSARDFVRTCNSKNNGVIVLDLKMPELSGLELQEYLVSTNNTLPIIFVSGHAEVSDAVMAMKLGSFDFIEKPYSSEYLLKRIRDAMEVNRVDEEKRIYVTELRARFETLTAREKSILTWVIAGKQSKFIADSLSVSVSTIDNHRANVMSKLKAETSSDLVRMALLVDPTLAFSKQ